MPPLHKNIAKHFTRNHRRKVPRAHAFDLRLLIHQNVWLSKYIKINLMKPKMKTPISYWGGKQMMVRHILPLIPEHKIYVEPFFGERSS